MSVHIIMFAQACCLLDTGGAFGNDPWKYMEMHVCSPPLMGKDFIFEGFLVKSMILNV